jgi:hypothetical protein
MQIMMVWTCSLSDIGKNSYTIFVDRYLEKHLLRRFKCEDNIKINISAPDFEDVNCTALPQDHAQMSDFVTRDVVLNVCETGLVLPQEKLASNISTV